MPQKESTVVKVRQDLHQAVKVVSAQRGITLQAAVEEALVSWLSKRYVTHKHKVEIPGNSEGGFFVETFESRIKE